MSEMFRFPCPACGHFIKAQPEQAGRRVKCPRADCGQSIRVPSEAGAAEDNDASGGQPKGQEQANPARKPKKSRRSKRARAWKNPWIAAGVAGFLLLLGLGAWMFTRSDDRDPAALPTDQSAAAQAKPPESAPDAPPPKKKARSTPQVTLSTPKPEGASGRKMRGPGLPGKEGPRAALLDSGDPNVKVREMYLDTTLPLKGSRPKTLPLSFPSGTKTLNLLIEFANPPAKLNVEYVVYSSTGGVDMTPTRKAPTWRYIDHNKTLCVFMRPRETAFPDGPYQVVVSLNGRRHFVLNWSIE